MSIGLSYWSSPGEVSVTEGTPERSNLSKRGQYGTNSRWTGSTYPLRVPVGRSEVVVESTADGIG